MKRDYQKPLKKLTFFFLLNSLPSNGQSYQKQKEPRTSDQSLFHHDNYGIINYSSSICPFESGKCEKEEEKFQKFEYLKNEKNFLGEIKTLFTVFEGLSFDKK